MMCPCKDCERRQCGCHCKCNDYKEWKEWYNDMKRREKLLSAGYPNSYTGWTKTLDGHWRNKKIRRKR